MRCICATRVFLGGKSRKKWRGRRRVQKQVYFNYFIAKGFWDRSAQFLVNCFEKIVMATNNSGLNYLLVRRATGKRKKRKA